MHGGIVVREARQRAGISQRELAARLGSHQSVVARWESLGTSPTLEAVCDACAACGFDLDWRLVTRDADLERVIRQQLDRSPDQRIAGAVALTRFRTAGA